MAESGVRGHDNVHDDMNMYVIMHDQCLFIAMINIFHTWSIAFHSMNSTFMHEPVWTMIITIYVHSLKPWSLIIMINVHGISYDHWSLTIIVHSLHVWSQIFTDGPKWSEISEMVPDGQRWSWMVKNGLRLFGMVTDCPRWDDPSWLDLVEDGLRWSTMVSR